MNSEIEQEHEEVLQLPATQLYHDYYEGKQYILALIALRIFFNTMGVLFTTYGNIIVGIIFFFLIQWIVYRIFSSKWALIKKGLRAVCLAVTALTTMGLIIDGSIGMSYDIRFDPLTNSIANTFNVNGLILTYVIAAFLVFNKKVKAYIKMDERDMLVVKEVISAPTLKN